MSEKWAKDHELIINSPYEEPARHWQYDYQQHDFKEQQGRRQAGYYAATPGAAPHSDPGQFHKLDLVNQIRERVSDWRQAGHPGATSITRTLLRHWHGQTAQRFFFCQLEAIETLIFLLEAPPSQLAGLEIPNDGGAFQRLCSKMATGSGKTIVMGLLIAWHGLNKRANPQDKRFCRDFLIIAPNLTVRDRLAVLHPEHEDSVYKEFSIIPHTLDEHINHVRIVICNWHALSWDTEAKIQKRRSVDKRGAKSNTAYVKDILGGMAASSRILVINDEAHHAWREPAGRGVKQAEIEEATVWMRGLDKINKIVPIARCHDFSATPFVPGGKMAEENLYQWIVSDFGFEDAVESGLVKIPRIVIEDDAIPDPQTYKSRLFHIYADEEVKSNLTRRSALPADSLPDLVRQAYWHLGDDWEKTLTNWQARKSKTPPVIISVVNNIKTAERIEHSLCNAAGGLEPDILRENTDRHLLRIDSDKLDEQGSKAQELRDVVGSVGKPGEKGADIRHVVAVGMLSEGWDTKTVTHIMGLRAFTSQLLCEQVVGRGLRRTSYDINEKTGLFEPEYVNVFGVPFTFLKRATGDKPPPPPLPPPVLIMPVPEKAQFAIQWPNVIRIESWLRRRLSLDMDNVKPLTLNATQTPIIVDLMKTMQGKTAADRLQQSLEAIKNRERNSTRAMNAAAEMAPQLEEGWQGTRIELVKEIYRLTRQLVRRGDKIIVVPEYCHNNPQDRLLIMVLNPSKVVEHIKAAITKENTRALKPIFDANKPTLSTSDMRPWPTRKPHKWMQKSHINYTPYESTWEYFAGRALDKHKKVAAWVKNDPHLGFVIEYMYQGGFHNYYPDFIIRLKSGIHLILEVKGRERPETAAKMEALARWTEAVSKHKAFGIWKWDIAREASEVHDILARHAAEAKI